jgi:hypothetical protein
MRILTLCMVTISLMVTLGAQEADPVRRYSRGAQVRERIVTKPSEPKTVGMIVTVVAVPGDRIRAVGSLVYVNEMPVTGFSKELLARMAKSTHLPAVMPENEYLVMGEQVTADDVFNKWGTYAADALEAAK